MITVANIYPNGCENPTIKNSDETKANIGFCFSGGGSRALTCAWGQMLGLDTLGIMQKARYVSCVSGGTWASSVYAFLPKNISDKDLLGSYYNPANLSLSKGDGKFDVSNFQSDYALGHAPNSMHLKTLIKEAGLFLIEHCSSSSDYKWLWAYLVSKHILKPFSLQSKGKYPWSSSKSFSLSKDYVDANFPNTAPSIDNLYLVNNHNRPFVIMNNNLMEAVGSNIVQLPNQVTPVAGGVKGEMPDKSIVGGGLVESYGVCSHINQNIAVEAPVNITIDQQYSLIDIVSTSSAFFAEFLAQELIIQLNDSMKKENLVNSIRADIKEETMKKLSEDIGENAITTEADISKIIEVRLEKIVTSDNFLSEIIPTYNYWSLGKDTLNKQIKYTDGGSLENLGILGMLAQTDDGTNSRELKIIAFDNTSTPLIRNGSNIIAGGQAAPLFGIDFDDSTGQFNPFSEDQKDPFSVNFKATSLVQVFDNSDNIFMNLVQGLYDANSKNGNNTAPAFYEMDLITVENTLANITAGRKVKLLYVQNAKMLNWQNAIGDEGLKTKIENGQKNSAGTFDLFKGFPYYSTFTKIGLAPEESNALSQMWAWAVCDDTELSKQIKGFVT